MRQAAWIAGVLLGMTAAASARPALNVDFAIGWAGRYRPQCWTPVEITIYDQTGEPFQAMLTFRVQQDDLTEMTIRRPIAVTPGVPLKVRLAAKVAFMADKCEVRIDEGRGQWRWKETYDLVAYGPRRRDAGTQVAAGDVLIGVVGRATSGMVALAEQAEVKNDASAERDRVHIPSPAWVDDNDASAERCQVHVVAKSPGLLPIDWAGYEALDVLVLHDPDWSRIGPQEADAICQWVRRGGRLMIVLGRHVLPDDHLLARLLPFKVDRPQWIAMSEDTLSAWPGPSSGPRRVQSWLPADAGASRLWTAAPVGAICADGLVGFGHVGVVGFDPEVLMGDRGEDQTDFWMARFNELLGAKKLARREADHDRIGHNPYQYRLGAQQDGAEAVLNYLTGIDELRPLSIWAVVVLLVSLTILVGPVDYFVLKRLGRLPLTWLTVSIWLALFTVGAYYGVAALRAGKMQLRVVSVLDGVAGDDRGWSTTYCGLFAAESDQYQLTGLTRKQWWSGATLTEGGHTFGYGSEGTREIDCLQHGGGNLPTRLPVNIWTMQYLLAESPVEAMPFTAEVTRRGDTIDVRIVNHAEVAIRNGSVCFADMPSDIELEIGRVAPGAAKEFLGTSPGISGGTAVWRTNGGHGGDAICRAEGSYGRTQAMGEYLARGAVIVKVEFDEAPLPFHVAGHEYTTHHVQLARLVVFPKEGVVP